MKDEPELYYYCDVIRDLVGGVAIYQFQHPNAANDWTGKGYRCNLVHAPGIVGFAGIEFEGHLGCWWGQVAMWEDLDEEDDKWLCVGQDPSNDLATVSHQRALIPKRVRFVK